VETADLNSKIDHDLIQAMKSKDTIRLSVLRMLKTALTNAKIQKGRERLEEAEVLEIIQKQSKQRQESLASFEKAGRQDLAEKERTELGILKDYLPAQLSEAEIETLARQAIARVNPGGPSAAGAVMKELMPAVKGKADGRLVNQVVVRLLGNR
jgi:uncharacterized protein YqeY